MRTRQRNIVLRSIDMPAATSAWTAYACNGAIAGTGSTLFPFRNVPVLIHEECMQDSDHGLGQANPVNHRKMVTSVELGDWPYIKANDSPYGRVAYDAKASSQWLGTRYDLLNQLAWSVSDFVARSAPPKWTISIPTNEESLKQDVIEKARQLKADHLLNLIEANQVWPALKSLTLGMPLLAYKWQTLRRQVPKMLRLREFFGTASGSYLAWKFGISPLLSDVGKTLNYLPKLGVDIKRHRDGQTQRFSRSAELVASFDARDTVRLSVNGYPCFATEYQGRIVSSPTIRYVLVVKPIVRYQTELFNQLDLVMRRFATSPANLAWEKVPFSFVLDWFVDIRGLLNKIDDCVGFEPYKVVSFTRSYSYHLQTSVNNVHKLPCDGSLIRRDVCGTREFKHYERSLASTKLLPSWKPHFGKSQAAITAALIAQKLSQLKLR